MAKRKKVKKAGKSVPSSRAPKIIWNPEIWDKLSKNFAAVEIRHQQSGKKASFRDMMGEAQGFLPMNLHRTLVGYTQTNHGFKKRVVKAREELLQKMKTEHKGKLNGASMEVFTSPTDKVGYEVPPGMVLNWNLKKALKEAGFQFMTLDSVTGIQEILGSRVERIERIALPSSS